MARRPAKLEIPLEGLSALRTVLPDSLVAEALQEFARQGQRTRKLPPAVVLWLTVGMALFRSISIDAVLRRLREEFRSTLTWPPERAPHSTAVTQARDRLGWEVVRAIFRRSATAIYEQGQGAMSWRGLSVLALDGTTFLAPDTQKNEDEFGRSTNASKIKCSAPQFRCVALISVWTHVVVDAAFGSYTVGELTLAHSLLERLRSGTLILMDRAYYSFGWLTKLTDADAFFLVRVGTGPKHLKPIRKKRLGRNEWLGSLPRTRYAYRRCRSLPRELQVRLLVARRKGFRPITLATNLLDRETYPADELAALYGERWEIETAYRELKTELLGEHIPFRSKTPDRVRQEAYALLLTYNCLRALMAEAASMRGCAPTELSFKNSLERICWFMGLLTYAGDRLEHYDLLNAIAGCRTQPRRKGRRCPRVLKYGRNKFPWKREPTHKAA